VEDLLVTEIPLGKRKAEFLGRCVAGSSSVCFARLDGIEVALIAAPATQGKKAFRAGRELSIEYRLYPRTVRDREAAPLVERVAADVLAREAEIAETLRPRSDPGPEVGPADASVAAPPAAPLGFAPGKLLRKQSGSRHAEDRTHVRVDAGSGGAVGILSLADEDGEFEYRIALPDSGRVAVLRFSERGAFPLKLFDWSARLTLASQADCALSRRDTSAVQQLLLQVVASLMLAIPKPLESPRHAAHASPGARFLYFELGKGSSAAVGDSDGVSVPTEGGEAILPGETIVLSLDVPTACDNRCVFCAPSEGVGAPPADSTAILTELSKLLLGLGPQLSEAGRVDVNLVGMDVFNFERIEDLVARVRAVPKVTRVTAVTPGTRLAAPGFASRLKSAGLDSVTLTILGPDASLHDTIAGRHGSYEDVLAAVANARAAGLDHEFNIVVIKDNAAALPEIFQRVGAMAARARIYFYVTEPFVPDELASRCYARLADVRRALDAGRAIIEGRVLSVHYLPLCILPDWVRPLAGHSSQKYPASPAMPPEPCKRCPAYLTTCGSVSDHYLRLFGSTELTPLGSPRT